MYARAEDSKVRISLSREDPEVYLGPLNELVDAEAAHDAQVTYLSTVDLQPFKDRVAAAQADVEDLFSETLTIEEAERLCSKLFGAITRAKANDGRFNTRVHRTWPPLDPTPTHVA